MSGRGAIAAFDDDLFAPHLNRDPYPYFAALRASDPVHWNALFRMWEVTRHADVAWVLKHPERFTSEKFRYPIVPYPPIPGGDLKYLRKTGEQARSMLINHDAPRHTAERAVIYPRFTPKAVEAWRPLVRNAVHALLDQVESRGAVDLLTAVALPLPVRVFAEIMGIPPEDRDHVCALTEKVLDGYGPKTGRARLADEGRQGIADYVRPLIEDRLRTPREDLLSTLCEGERTGVWTRDELIANATLLVLGGHETTANLLCNGAVALLRHPRQWRELLEDPRGLAESATEECLRYDASVRSVLRVAKEEVRLGDVTIRQHDRVRWWIISANRDEAVFDEPDRFDIHRSPNPHLSFGTGVHYCMGAALARVEGQEFFCALAERLPGLRLDTDEIEYHPLVTLRSPVSVPVSWR